MEPPKTKTQVDTEKMESPPASIPFDAQGRFHIPSAYDGRIELHKSVFENHILRRHCPNRFDLNWNKIPTTLVIPDSARETSDPDVHIYYKEFKSFFVKDGISVPTPPYWRYCMVVIQAKKKFVITAYDVPRMKKGKELKGE